MNILYWSSLMLIKFSAPCLLGLEGLVAQELRDMGALNVEANNGRVDFEGGVMYVTTNLRVLVENDWFDDLLYVCEPTEYHEKRITARFTCDRGVSHEIVRHRVMSFAQESTRYCNYGKDKFGNELTFIMPHNESVLTGPLEANSTFVTAMMQAEHNYFDMLGEGFKPQIARQVLPNALKTEIVVTGFESDWKHFLELRTAGAAHPDMRKLAVELKELMYGKEV